MDITNEMIERAVIAYLTESSAQVGESFDWQTFKKQLTDDDIGEYMVAMKCALQAGTQGIASRLDATDKIKLLLAKVEILKLKADSYNWQCHTPDEVKKQLESVLTEITHLTQPARG